MRVDHPAPPGQQSGARQNGCRQRDTTNDLPQLRAPVQGRALSHLHFPLGSAGDLAQLLRMVMIVSYELQRFPSEIIAHTVGLRVRFNLSPREVEEILL